MSHEESIADLERILSTIEEKVLSISESIAGAREVLNNFQNVEMAEVSPLDGTLPEMNSKLSDAARFAIEISQGPLEPEDLKKFLMDKAFGKPKPDVLPIVRQYTPSIADLIVQLNSVKDINNQAHSRYKEEQRRLDVNLNKRIDTLVANMKKELEKETAERRSQTSMNTFVQRWTR